MRHLITHLNRIVERVLILAMIAIVAVVCWQVFSRFILRAPSSSTEELARFLLIWIGVLGASYAYRTKAHLGLDLFYQKMIPSLRRKCTFIIELCVLFTASSILVYGGCLLMMLSFELNQTSAALGINMGYIYIVLPLSGGLIVINCIENLVTCAQQKLSEDA